MSEIRECQVGVSNLSHQLTSAQVARSVIRVDLDRLIKRFQRQGDLPIEAVLLGLYEVLDGSIVEVQVTQKNTRDERSNGSRYDPPSPKHRVDVGDALRPPISAVLHSVYRSISQPNKHSGDETSYVSEVVDSRNDEPQGHVDGDDNQKAGEALPSDFSEPIAMHRVERHETSEETEYRAAGADTERVRSGANAESVACHASGQARDEVEREKSPVSVDLFELMAEDVQGEAVEAEVQNTRVKECGRKQPPVLAGGDVLGLHRAELQKHARVR